MPMSPRCNVQPKDNFVVVNRNGFDRLPNMVILPYKERQHCKKCNIMIMIMAACPARPYQQAPPLPGLAVTRTLEERAAG